MGSKASGAFTTNSKDVVRLWEIHEDVGGQGAGRKRDVEILNRTAIVFITACWEAYVEDVAMEAFNLLLTGAKDSSAIPPKVQAFVGRRLVEAKNPQDVWRLADLRWRAEVTSYGNEVKEKWVSTLNTPKSPQVNTLFEELLGIVNLSSHWHWGAMSATRAAKKLDDYITVRGNIAHRVKHDADVYKDWGTDYLNHVQRLVGTTDDAISKHLAKFLGARPW